MVDEMKEFSRQSFLGPDSDAIFGSVVVGVVGLGGGGSHVIQQLAHLGVRHFVIADPDIVEDHNLNRLVGATRQDAAERVPKVRVAERVIRGLTSQPSVVAIQDAWQASAIELRACHVLFGCVDSFSERNQIEQFSRRFLIPYIDIGMDVHEADDKFIIGGQVALSTPSEHCLWCMGILDKESIADEVRRYGAAGGRPQVVWPNGVLASVAVGLFVQLVTPWHDHPISTAYLEYDGNSHTVKVSNRLAALAGRQCSHFHPGDRGDAFFGRPSG
jgi:molybdopterin-synthase adenylyltransferase